MTNINIYELQKGEPRQVGTVHFDSSPSGALVYIDGQLIEEFRTEEPLRTPASVSVIEGRRNFTLRLQGYNDEVGYVDIFPGRSVNINRNLTQGSKEEGPEPQINLTSLTISSFGML